MTRAKPFTVRIVLTVDCNFLFEKQGFFLTRAKPFTVRIFLDCRLQCSVPKKIMVFFFGPELNPSQLALSLTVNGNDRGANKINLSWLEWRLTLYLKVLEKTVFWLNLFGVGFCKYLAS